MTSRVIALGLAVALAGCEKPHKAEQIPIGLISVVGEAELRTSSVGGRMSAAEIAARVKLGETNFDPGEGVAVDASYVLVDAENRSAHDAYVTLDGTLRGQGDRTASLKAESLFVPAGGQRTFLLLDDALAPQPWAQGVKVDITGAIVAKFPPPMAIADVTVSPDSAGDRVIASASVTSTAEREGKGIVLAAFHDEHGKPISRGHSILILQPGTTQTVRFVGPPHSRTATIYAGESTF